jgi:signal transduction histidine kinase
MHMAELSKFADFGRISTGLFHDLMAPLSAIVMSLQEIERDTHPDLPDLRNQLERSVMASKRMDQFMTAIKKRIRSDDSRQVFKADDLVREAIGLFRYKAMREGVTASLSSPQSLEIFGNPMKFSQVIENLISNAIDAYAHPGTYARRDIVISLKKKKARVQIRVEDWGSGIPPAVMPKIFEPFFTTKPRDTGTGLGLWITKEIVENEFRGSIRAHSTPGRGTQFNVIMERQRASSQRGSTKIVLWGE